MTTRTAPPVSLRRGAATLAVTATLACGLAGCGGSDAATPAAAAPSAGNRAGGARIDPALQQKITQCLQAAGIAVPSFTPRPSGRPRPTGQPRPSGAPGAGQRGGFGAVFNSPAAKAALQACGITLPTRGAQPSGAPAA